MYQISYYPGIFIPDKTMFYNNTNINLFDTHNNIMIPPVPKTQLPLIVKINIKYLS